MLIAGVVATLVGIVIIGLLLSLRLEVHRIQSATSRNSQDIQHNSQDIQHNSQDIQHNSQDIQNSNDLVATHVSHELRTPLTTITGTLATLEKNRDRISPEQQSDMLRAAMHQAEVLESLITGMISLEPPEQNEGTTFPRGRRRLSGARGRAKGSLPTRSG